MRYKKIDSEAFKKLTLNAGILVSTFTPSSGAYSGLLGATTGGLKFTDTPEYVDFGEDIDNCPKNTMELKKLKDREVKCEGTFLTVTPDTAKSLISAGDVDSVDGTKIVPRDTLEIADFEDIWLVVDYSDKNGATKGGYVAIHLKNCINSTGFQLQTADAEKGQMAFSYLAHYSLEDITEQPYELYISAGASET